MCPSLSPGPSGKLAKTASSNSNVTLMHRFYVASAAQPSVRGPEAVNFFSKMASKKLIRVGTILFAQGNTLKDSALKAGPILATFWNAVAGEARHRF
jgi:hypothetical protein